MNKATACTVALTILAVAIPLGCDDGGDGGGGQWVIPLEFVAQTPDGVHGDNRTIRAVASSDGSIVAFCSNSANLVAGDTAGTHDMFLRDLTNDTLQCVSVAEGTTAPAGGCEYDIGMSSDGTMVAFATDVALVAADGNAGRDVYLYDASGAAPVLTRISLDTGDADPDGSSDNVTMSADGSAVVFDSTATDLIASDGNATDDVFLCDLSGTPAIERVSVADDESESDGSSGGAAVSADGDAVAFSSNATNLVTGDDNGFADIFVRIRSTSATERVSVATGGAQADGSCGSAMISGDGRYVAFQSVATNLVTGDTNGVSDIFVHDRTGGTTVRVSVSSTGVEADNSCWSPRISADGRFVLFSTSATNLVVGDTNGNNDHFLHDLTTGETVRVNYTYAGAQEADAGDSGPCGFSGDNEFILYVTGSASVPADTNGSYDAYMRPNPLMP